MSVKLLCALMPFFGVACAQNAPATYDMLMDFFRATNGQKWYDNTNWGSGLPFKEWFGLSMEGDELGGMRLSDNNLSGSLNQIGDLFVKHTFYDDVDLSHNNLSGDCPALPKGAALFLSHNMISCGNLSLNNFHFVDVSYNKFSGVGPGQIGNSQVDEIDFSFNQFTSIGPLEGDLVFVKYHHNALAGPLYPYWQHFSQLEGLDVSYNQLTGDLNFSNFSIMMQHLNLANNKFTRILNSTEIPEGVKCQLENNPFRCPIPLWAKSRCNASCA